MIPKAKKNLHECEYHLRNMETATHKEDFDISYAALVNSARNVTFVLQKEFGKDDDFKNWYGDQANYDKNSGQWIGDGEEKTETKIYEMRTDPLCKYFNTLRSQIVKEGINSLVSSTQIGALNTGTDMIDRPKGASIAMRGDGIYYHVNKGTGQEDLIPARTRGTVVTSVSIQNPPTEHLGNEIPNGERDVLSLVRAYYQYLKNIVEEWTVMVNSRS